MTAPAERIGTVFGSRNPSIIVVRWDGGKTPCKYLPADLETLANQSAE